MKHTEEQLLSILHRTMLRDARIARVNDLSTGKAHARSPSSISPETSYIQRVTDSWTVPNISRISAHWPPNLRCDGRRPCRICMPRRPKYRQLTYSSRSGGLSWNVRLLLSFLARWGIVASRPRISRLPRCKTLVVVYCTCSRMPAETCMLTAILW